jgi:hypothetical protein
MGHTYYRQREKLAPTFPEAEFLVLRVFLLAIHSHLYSFALRFLFLQTHAPLTVSTIQYILKTKGGKPYPLSYGLKNSCRNLKSENSQGYAQKPP